GVGIKVFSLQADPWQAPRDDVFIKYNFKTSTSVLTDFTICYRFQRTVFASRETHFSYALPDMDNALKYSWEKGWPDWDINGLSPYEPQEYNIPISLYKWMHFCHVYNNTSYQLFIDGNVFFTAKRTMPIQNVNMSGILIIGQEQDSFGGGFSKWENFRGHITQFNIWNKALQMDTIRNVAFGVENRFGIIFSSENADLILNEVDQYKIELKELLKPNNKSLLFSDEVTFSKAEYLCKSIGSSLYLPLNSSQYTELIVMLGSREELKQKKIWLGMTDFQEEGIWRSISSNKTVNNWQMETNGGTNENCAITSTFSDGKVEDFFCDYNCAFGCETILEAKIRLRGLCFKKPIESWFMPTVTDTGDMLLHGLYGHMVKYNNSHWELIHVNKNVTVATIPDTGKFYPIGRREWTLVSEVCDTKEGEVITLSFSVCQYDQFMCDNGDCIPVNERCDSKTDCADLSDESGCNILTVPSTSPSHIPPKNQVPTKSLGLQLAMNLIRIPNVGDTVNSINVEFELYITWTDSRLQYHNLQPDDSFNRLSKVDFQKIWYPKLKFLKTIGGNIKIMDEYVKVNITDDAEDTDHNDVIMDIIYKGSSASLIYYQHYIGTFACSFDVFYYPLDKQKCSLTFKLTGVNENSVKIIQENIKTQYLGDIFLPAFQFMEIGVGLSRDAATNIEFTLLRRPMFIVFSTFVPTFMLLLIGYATLYLKTSLVQVRLVVSLTTLLVLYTLFNQTSASLPKTAYVKMVDVLFFFDITMLFFIILFHVTVDSLPPERDDDSFSTKSSTSKCQISVKSVVVCMRYLIVPMLASVFFTLFTLVMIYQL
ncbi:unnamed protein product, partial [Meganyctiphanes norvegica]